VVTAKILLGIHKREAPEYLPTPRTALCWTFSSYEKNKKSIPVHNFGGKSLEMQSVCRLMMDW
jgi:hypothetical protein